MECLLLSPDKLHVGDFLYSEKFLCRNQISVLHTQSILTELRQKQMDLKHLARTSYRAPKEDVDVLRLYREAMTLKQEGKLKLVGSEVIPLPIDTTLAFVAVLEREQ